MKISVFKLPFFVFLLLLSKKTYGCGVTPNFSYNTTHTCGLPYIVKATNTSSGNGNNLAKYWWKLNGKMASDTIIGRDSIGMLLKTVGNHKLRLFVKDTSGCIDSTSQTTITVSSNAKTIKDQNYNYTLSPVWMNCLQFINDPDSFRIDIESNDTMNSVKIFWGDGASDVSGNTLLPNIKKTHLYNALGVFTVKIVTTNGSCIDTVYGTVYNQRQPTAGIVGPTSGSNRGCVPHTLRIVNNSYNISNNTYFVIDWGNGDAQTMPYNTYKDTIYHTYRKGVCSGVIKITATNVCGSSFTTWNPIDISEKDKAQWAVTKTCNPSQNHVFQNTSTDKYCLTPDIKEFYWDFGDNTNSGWINSKAAQYHKYMSEGDYIVTLIAKSACGNDTFRDRVSVYYNPTAAFKFSNPRGCKPLSVTVTDTSKGRGITRLWTVTEGSNTYTYTDSVLNYTFTVPGNNTISLKVTNLCGSNTLTRNFRVNDKPKAGFATINGTCVPMTVSYNNTTASSFTNPTYKWEFGDGTTSTVKNPASKIYSTPGNYTVKLIVADSCGVDTFSQTFTAYGLPVAILSGDTVGCTFDSLKFNNQSTNSTTYNWSFGDNQTANSSSLGIYKHMYTTTGAFQVRLIAGTGAGCKDTAYHNLYIKPGAKAQFSINKTFGCNPTTFKFTNSSFYAKDYKWYANGKLVSTDANANDTTIYTDSTVVKMKLIVTSNSSCQGDSMERTFFTAKNPKPVVNALDSGCGPLKITFANNSTNSVSYSWNLGNGTSSTLKNPVSTYQQAYTKDTVYRIKLSVTNWLGCKDSTYGFVRVFPSPTSAFELDKTEGCGPLTINVTNTSYTNNKKPFSSLSHQWRFGDGTSSSDVNPSHTYYASDYQDTFFSIKLKVVSINGCANSSVQTIQVFPNPTAQFTPDKVAGCGILPVKFTNSSTPKDTGNIDMMSFLWNSGNGVTSTVKDLTANYAASMYSDTVYTATLIGTSEHGCKDTNTFNITVHPQPHAQFITDVTTGCTPLKVKTTNQSFSKDGGTLNHGWNFGNGYQAFVKEDSTVLINNSNADMNFTINYQATSQYGCKDSASTVITVRPKPVAKLTVSTKKACAPIALTVNDNSINAASYIWGEGSTSYVGGTSTKMLLQGQNLFDSLYIIKHAVTSVYGCVSDTAYEQVIAMGKPQAVFTTAKDSACARENVQLINTSLGGYRYLWRFGDNTTSNQVNPRHKYSINALTGRDSVYNVSLEVSSVAGCKDTTKNTVYLVNRPVDKIVLDKQTGCTDLEITMGHASKAFKTLFWDFGDNSSYATNDTVKHTYINPMGNLTMQPKIALYRQRFNCMDTATTMVYVYPKPVSEFKTQRNDPCDAGNYQFINKSKNNVSNEWIFNDGSVVNVSSFSTILPASKERDTFYSVALYVKNNYQCVDSSRQVIKVKPKMNIEFTKTPNIICQKGVVNFTNRSTGAVRYFWKFGDGGLSNEVNPAYVYNQYGTYKIQLYGYDKDGCVDSSSNSEIFKVLEKPKADFTFLPAMPKLPNATVNFIGKPLITTANVSDLTYEWNFGDGSFPTNNKGQKDPSHTYTKSGNVEVTMTVWNKGCSDVAKRPIYIEDPKPEVSFSADTTVGCAALKVRFKNFTTNAYAYRWVWGDGTPDSYEKEPVHTFEFSGKWDVTLIATGTGGTTTYTIPYMVTVYPRPDADFFTNKRFLNLPNAVFGMVNMSNNAIKYNWYIYDTFNNVIDASTLRDPSFLINEEGKFDVKLIATNSYGCTDTMMKNNYIGTFKEGYVYLPSAFSPNSNGKNDDFKPSLYNVKPDQYVFRIFNRWGELVFETTDMTEAWDGTHNGIACEQEVYVWAVSGLFINGDNFALRGTVTLLK